MSYTIVDNKILSTNAEIDIVDHCNLACRSCSHLSPIAHEMVIAPERLALDLRWLAKVFHVGRIKILGGEPLLHPRLGAVIDAVRDSEIANTIALITNGHLLERLDDHCLSLIDEVVVSAYVSALPPKKLLASSAKRIRMAGVKFTVNRFDRFRETFSVQSAESAELVKRVYRSCEIAHKYGCFNIRDGYFYKCPQARVLNTFFDKPVGTDGVQISDDPGLFQKLLSYLKSDEPLNACHFCLGTVGGRFQHIQIQRKKWIECAAHPYAELVDFTQLEALESGDPTTGERTYQTVEVNEL